MKTIHTYVGWAVKLRNGTFVNFTSQLEALAYLDEKSATVMVRTLSEVQCGKERGRRFCSHCRESTYTRTV